MTLPTKLAELRALREKATQLNQPVRKWDSAENMYIATLITFFDLPSTQAMLEAGERTAPCSPPPRREANEHAENG